MFQPKLPLAKRANSIAFATGSSAPIRSTVGARRSSLLQRPGGDRRRRPEHVDRASPDGARAPSRSPPARCRGRRTAPGRPSARPSSPPASRSRARRSSRARCARACRRGASRSASDPSRELGGVGALDRELVEVVGPAAAPSANTWRPPVRADPSGPSSRIALSVSSPSSPSSATSSGAPTGSATSDAAAIPAGQSASSTTLTAAGPGTPPVEGKTASAAAAASAIGDGAAIRVVFLVAKAGKPSSSLSLGHRHLADHDLRRRGGHVALAAGSRAGTRRPRAPRAARSRRRRAPNGARASGRGRRGSSECC